MNGSRMYQRADGLLVIENPHYKQVVRRHADGTSEVIEWWAEGCLNRLEERQVCKLCSSLPPLKADQDVALLTRKINDLVVATNPDRLLRKHAVPLHKQRQQLARLIATLEEAKTKIETCRPLIESVAPEFARLHEGKNPPADLSSALEGIAEFLGVLRLANIFLWQKQQKFETRTKPRRPDVNRFIFCGLLAKTFEEAFGLLASATEDGPWISFLSNVLSIAEGNALGTKAAYRLWLKARRARAATKDQRVPLMSRRLRKGADTMV
jgi:hypothetical protein